MEHRHDQHVDADRMHPTFRQQEQTFRDAAGALWTEEESLRSRLRADPNLSAEQRQDAYRARRGELQRRYEGLAQKFSTDVSRGVAEAQQLLTAGSGSKFSEHLTALANTPTEQLEELYATARRAGQADLERAVAAVAYQRGVRPVWTDWAEANPKRAEAIKLLRSVPGAEQLHTRTSALRPPRADTADLEPTEADLQAARTEAATTEASRQAFFAARSSGPRRQVGSRVM